MTQNIVIESKISVAEIHSNTQTTVIVITEDKLENVINKHIEGCVNKGSWQTPLGLVLAILTTFITSEFKDALGVEKSAWKAVFLIGAFISFCWLAKTLSVRWQHRKTDTLQLITTIKNQAHIQTNPTQEVSVK